MDSRVFFYSERGFINCLVLDLKKNLDMCKVFFKCIRFGTDESTLDWADNILAVEWYVEFSASEFGNPDLIADVCCPDGHHVVFFEAKLKPYQKAAAVMDMNKPFEPNSNGIYEIDGIYKNKSSSINAQLALRYRLAHTLEQAPWADIQSCLQGDVEVQIEEKYEDCIAYHDMFSAIRYNTGHRTGRRIHNSRMIEVFNKMMQNQPDFYFVAMTFETQDHLFRTLQEKSVHLLPPIGMDKWQKDHQRFGILDFNQLINTLQLENDSFRAQSRDYIYYYTHEAVTNDMADADDDEEAASERNSESSKERVLRKATDESKEYAEWFDWFQNIGRRQFSDNQENCSLIVHNQVVIKLFYSNKGVYVGFRDTLPGVLKPYQDRSSFRTVRSVLFVCLPVQAVEQNNLRHIIQTYIEKENVSC